MNYFLEGEKIHLRAFTKSDIATWFDWFNAPIVTEHMNKGIFPNTELLQEEHFDKLLKSKTDLQLAIALKEDNKLIGIIGIHKINWVHRTGDVSVLIGDKQYWGKGIAKEAMRLVVNHAFTKMNLRRLNAGMVATNKGSRKCFEHCGFKLEGTKQKAFFYKDRYVDVYMLGLLKEEWEKNCYCKR